MTDEPLTECDEHGTPVQRVFHPVAVHFKGSGFYNTDYGKKKPGAGAEGKPDKSSDSDSKSSSTSDAAPKKTESGSASKDPG